MDVDITSIKRKKATLDGMANVLNEFLHGVSKGFQDAAFASFSRRRSTVREDIDQHFATDPNAAMNEPGAGDTSAKGKGYLDMLNAPSEGADASSSSTVVKSGRGKSSSKKGSSKKSTASKKTGTKKRGRPKKKSSDGMKSL